MHFALFDLLNFLWKVCFGRSKEGNAVLHQAAAVNQLGMAEWSNVVLVDMTHGFVLGWDGLFRRGLLVVITAEFVSDDCTLAQVEAGTILQCVLRLQYVRLHLVT